MSVHCQHHSEVVTAAHTCDLVPVWHKLLYWVIHIFFRLVRPVQALAKNGHAVIVLAFGLDGRNLGIGQIVTFDLVTDLFVVPQPQLAGVIPPVRVNVVFFINDKHMVPARDNILTLGIRPQ